MTIIDVMRVIFEKGDIIKVKTDGWDWKKGEIVIVEKWHCKVTIHHNDWYSVKLVNSEKESNLIIDYMVEKA